ncbi:MAG: Lrp/AsnC ligand binding domain-containing protein, partial [Pseudomonadota bacterium]|nr:Lrp/AsnC ligand binding domain-containing protein [Pseudomonadota bacterium]
RLERQLASNFAAFEEKIRQFPEVVECWLMTGSQDYLLKLSTSDVRAFERFLTEDLTAIDKVSSVDTSIPLRCVKANESRLIS